MVIGFVLVLEVIGSGGVLVNWSMDICLKGLLVLILVDCVIGGKLLGFLIFSKI